MQLYDAIAVLTQQLLPKIGGGRALATGLMMVSMATRNLIRDGKTPRHSTIATPPSRTAASPWISHCCALCQSRKITRDRLLRDADPQCKESHAVKRNIPNGSF